MRKSIECSPRGHGKWYRAEFDGSNTYRLKKTSLRFGLCLLAIALGASPVMGHAPHDVINLIQVSPNFTNDGTILAVVLLTDHLLLTRSTDGGKSWTAYAHPVMANNIKALAFSPDFANDQMVFAGTRFGGVWCSTDAGITWEAKVSGLTSTYVNDLSFSPDFANDRTLLAATEGGVFRSADAGESWSLSNTGFQENSATAIRFVPGDPNTAFAGEYKIHRSDDGGATWTYLDYFNYPMIDLEISPNYSTDGKLATVLEITAGVMASSDGGSSWGPANTGLTDLSVTDICVASDGTAFAVTATDGCFRASTLGSSWTLVDQGFEELSDQTTIHYYSVEASPGFASDQKVFVGSFEGFFRSDNRGDLWKQCEVYSQRLCRRMSISPDYRFDRTVFLGNYGGGPMAWDGAINQSLGLPLVSSTRSAMGPSGGPNSQAPAGPVSGFLPSGSTIEEPVEWEALDDSLDYLFSGALIASPQFNWDRTLFYAHVGLWRSQDAGRTWTKLSIPASIPRDIAYSPQYDQDGRVFMGTPQQGTFYSTDRGDSWFEFAGGLPSDILTKHIRISPGYPSHGYLYIATGDDGVWRSRDGGTLWQKASNGLGLNNVRSLALSPDFVNDGLLLSGTGGAGLYRSDNKGDTWSALNGDFPSGAENIIESIAFSPDFAQDRTVFLASSYDGVYKSVDGGWTWDPARNGLPLDCPREIELSPNYAQDSTVFLTTHNWVWRSRDGGQNWERISGYNRVDDTHQSVTSTGDWYSQIKVESFGLRISYSYEPLAKQQFEFYGNSVAWYAIRGPESGIAEIYIDELLEQEIDLYAPSIRGEEEVFRKSLGSLGWHTIEVRVTGTKNPASSNFFVKSDGFDFTF